MPCQSVVFFFSSRRRHTSWPRDWSSDVCSSDLTPTFLHAPMASAALEAGLHVLCEKPMAENSAGAARMVEAATRAGRVLDVSFHHRQRGDVAALRRVVASGVLGTIGRAHVCTPVT